MGQRRWQCDQAAEAAVVAQERGDVADGRTDVRVGLVGGWRPGDQLERVQHRARKPEGEEAQFAAVGAQQLAHCAQLGRREDRLLVAAVQRALPAVGQQHDVLRRAGPPCVGQHLARRLQRRRDRRRAAAGEVADPVEQLPLVDGERREGLGVAVEGDAADARRVVAELKLVDDLPREARDLALVADDGAGLVE